MNTSHINNIKYINLYAGQDSRAFGRAHTPVERRIYLDDDNKSLHKYGLSDRSHIWIELKDPSLKSNSSKYGAPSPEPSPEPSPAPSPAPSPSPIPTSSVIRAELVSSSRNDEITILKSRIDELERRLISLEDKKSTDKKISDKKSTGEGITLNL